MFRVISSSLIALLLVNVTASAQDKSKVMRSIYEVRFGNAKNLADVLGKHYKGEDNFQAVPEATSNSILLSGTAAILMETQSVLDKLDRAPRQVQLQIWIGEVMPGKGSEIPGKTLSGTIEEVSTRLDELHHKGSISKLRRYELKATENLPASTMHGEQKAFATGGSGGFGGGKKTMSMQYRHVGVKLEATPRLSPTGELFVELKLDDSRPYSGEDSPVIGTDEAGLPIRMTDVLNSQVESRISLRSGNAVMLEGVVTRSKSGTSQTVIIVGAQVTK